MLLGPPSNAEPTHARVLSGTLNDNWRRQYVLKGRQVLL